MRTRSIRIAPAIGILLFVINVLAQSTGWQANVIHVGIEGLRSDRGQVLCGLFSSAADFPKKADRAVAHAKSSIADRHAMCEFQDVPPGTYAVSVFHDENLNGKLDTNFLGIPREGVGASYDAKGHFGLPTFSSAAFQHSSNPTVLKITINYL
ncbi:MAG TPA: DUF2141 domain-containing protein [Terriglobales bacterium]|nr:DUF2141 domain-containing protein [Terriglobales bacterium]